jgi:hypothetical protein
VCWFQWEGELNGLICGRNLLAATWTGFFEQPIQWAACHTLRRRGGGSWLVVASRRALSHVCPLRSGPRGGLCGVPIELLQVVVSVHYSSTAFCVDRYLDAAVGTMAKNAAGKKAMTVVTLRLEVTFSGEMHPTGVEQNLARNAAEPVLQSSPPNGGITSAQQ